MIDSITIIRTEELVTGEKQFRKGQNNEKRLERIENEDFKTITKNIRLQDIEDVITYNRVVGEKILKMILHNKGLKKELLMDI